jgi:hypothetical protein
VTWAKVAAPRPDQRDTQATPRSPAAGARLLRLGGVPKTASALNVTPQAATTFHTFGNAGRLFTVGLAFAAGSDASYSAAVDQFYARVVTISGLVLCSVQISISAPSDHDSGNAFWRGPEAGVPFAAGDGLQLDVNNGAGVSGGFGAMRADCEAFFAIP